MNLVHFLLVSEQLSGEQVSIPVAFESFCKPEIYTDKKNGKLKRKSKITKNQIVRDRLQILVHQNQIPFSYVNGILVFFLCKYDICCSRAETSFCLPYQKELQIAVSLEDKLAGHWQSVSSMA